MTQINDIRNAYFIKGFNISEIARLFNVDRKTVRKYVYQENWNMFMKAENSQEAFPKLAPFKADIDLWLEEDKRARRKQRHTALKCDRQVLLNKFR